MSMSRRQTICRDRAAALRVLVLLCLLVPAQAHSAGFKSWWHTPDQQGQQLMARGEYLEAAATFDNPAWRAAAYYRGGDFESAASLYGRIRTPEAAYNRGNALVFLGRYDDAIESYELALQGRPGLLQAQQNLEIARLRKQRLAPPEDDAGGTGGQMEADEIVFDDSGRVNKSGTEQVADGVEAMSDEEMRAVWLRRVSNDPADFLRTRFAYQLFREEQSEGSKSDPSSDE